MKPGALNVHESSMGVANGERRIGRRAEQKRRWDESARHPCGECGRPGVNRQSKNCPDCRDRLKREARNARYRDIERRWMAGESLATIGAAHGIAIGTLAAILTRMRQEGGWNVQRRYSDERVEAQQAARWGKAA